MLPISLKIMGRIHLILGVLFAVRVEMFCGQHKLLDSHVYPTAYVFTNH